MTEFAEPVGDDRLVDTFHKSDREEIYGSLSTWRDVLRADLRTYVLREGEPTATKKGLNVPASQLPRLRQMIDALIEAAAE